MSLFVRGSTLEYFVCMWLTDNPLVSEKLEFLYHDSLILRGRLRIEQSNREQQKWQTDVTSTIRFVFLLTDLCESYAPVQDTDCHDTVPGRRNN